MAPKLLEMVDAQMHSAPVTISHLVDDQVEAGPEFKTAVMMGKFVPKVFALLAEV